VLQKRGVSIGIELAVQIVDQLFSRRVFRIHHFAE
jgi:hypothetical protein